MPDRIDSIIARIVELETKVADLLDGGEDSPDSKEPRMTTMDVDQRIKATVPKIVESEVESALAKSEAITRSIVMSAIQERLTPTDTDHGTFTSDTSGDRDPQVIPKRKPASKRTKAKKE